MMRLRTDESPRAAAMRPVRGARAVVRACGVALVLGLFRGIAVTGAAAGAASAAEPTPEDPWIFATQHVDLGVDFEPAAGTGGDRLRVVLVDEDAHPAKRVQATNAVVLVPEVARRELPVDLPPIGVAGDPVWLIPAGQDVRLPYLGVSAEGLAASGFAGSVEFRLARLEGPGQFFLWQTEVGGVTFRMNSRDGLGPDDRFVQLVGGHSHANWGFTQPGVYRLYIEASARRTGATTNIVSEPTPVTFHVLPLPPVELTPFERWQAARWPGETDPARIGSSADPDGDGRANLVEYFEGTDPGVGDASPAGVLSAVVTGQGTARQAGVRVRRVPGATDVAPVLWAAGSVAGPWVAVQSNGGAWRALPGGLEEAEWLEAVPVGNQSPRFYRLELRLAASSRP